MPRDGRQQRSEGAPEDRRKKASGGKKQKFSDEVKERIKKSRLSDFERMSFGRWSEEACLVQPPGRVRSSKVTQGRKSSQFAPVEVHGRRGLFRSFLSVRKRARASTKSFSFLIASMAALLAPWLPRGPLALINFRSHLARRNPRKKIHFWRETKVFLSILLVSLYVSVTRFQCVRNFHFALQIFKEARTA